MNDSWKNQIEKLELPYPARFQLTDEIEEHLRYFPEEKNNLFAEESLNDFYQIHNTSLKKALDGFGPRVSRFVQNALVLFPLSGLILFLGKERFMIDFIRQGGAGMIAILLVGLGLIFRELNLFVRTILIKDHSRKNLQIDSISVVLGSLALVLLGVGVTCLGAYVTVTGVVENKMGYDILAIGLKESITAVIVSTSFASLILLLHFSTRRFLVSWKAPLVE